MWYLEVNGVIIPRPYRWIEDAKKEWDRLKEEMGPCCISIIWKDE